MCPQLLLWYSVHQVWLCFLICWWFWLWWWCWLVNWWWSLWRGWGGGAALKNESIHFQLLASRAAAFLKTSTYLHLGHRPFTKLWLNFAEKESPERSAQREARELTFLLMKLMVTTYAVYMRKTSCLYVYCTFSVHSLGWWKKNWFTTYIIK